MTGARMAGAAAALVVLGCAAATNDRCNSDSDCLDGRSCHVGHCVAGGGGSHPRTAGLAGMVFLSFPGGDFWIDAYEASLVPGAGVLGSASLDQDGDGKIADRKTAMAHARSHGVQFDE